MHPLLEQVLQWLWRRKSPALLMMRIGVMFVALALGGSWGFDVTLPFGDDAIDFRFSSDGFAPVLLVYAAGTLGISLGIAGAIWEIVRYLAEEKRRDRKRIIVIEARGLRNAGGDSLLKSLPDDIEGHRESLLLDIRQGIKDGVIVDPAAALAEVVTLPADIRRRESGLDREDISIVYGGLTPVPFTFLTGILVDDEASVSVYDWNRHKNIWQNLNSYDDGNRFTCHGLEDVVESAPDVALTISVSYEVNRKGAQGKRPDIPFVHLQLDNGGPDCHWSTDKQIALGRQFLDVVIALGNRNVGRIHCFFAAPNSVVFRFGRLYDKRNLPEIVVYQYQQDAEPPFPWGILMPVAGQDEPLVVTR